MNSKIHKIYFEPTTKVNVSGGYEGSSTNGWVQGFDTLFWDDNRINALSNAATVNPIILSGTLAQTFNNRSSALTGAAITVLAFAEPFIAAGAAVGFLVLFSYRKRTRPPRL
jgi:hypothetical protein